MIKTEDVTLCNLVEVNRRFGGMYYVRNVNQILPD
jgi:hypothetical protein